MKEKKPYWLVFWTGYLAYSLVYAARLNFSVASGLMEAENLLTKTQIGMVGSVFSFTYALSKVPNGYLGDRRSSRGMIVGGLCLVGLSNLMIGWNPRFESLVILWGVNACGQSMIWGPLLCTFSGYYGEERLKGTSQFLVSSVAAGSILGLVLASSCSLLWGAAGCFVIPGASAVFMAALAWLILPDVPGQTPKNVSLWAAVSETAGDDRFRHILIPAMAHGMIKDNINVWLAVYFMNTYGMSGGSVAGCIFFVPFFAFVGRLLYPLLYRRLKSEYRVSACSFLLCVISSAILCKRGLPIWGALLCLGVLSAMVSVINTHMLSAFPADFAAQGRLSFVASMMDLVAYGGAGLGSLLFGILIQYFGYGGMFAVWGLVSGISVFVLLRSSLKIRFKVAPFT